MKTQVIHITALWIAMLFAVPVKANGIHGTSGHNNIALEFGYTNFRPYGLNNLVEPGFSGFSQLVTFGVGGTADLLTNAANDWDATWSFHLYLPHRVEANPDHTSWTAHGWELMTSFYGFDIVRKIDFVDFVLAPGVYWGNLKLDDGDKLYKNPFVAPMFRTDLRFNIWRFAVGGRVSYRHDITDAKWKRRDDGLDVLPGYKFREGQYMVYLAWNIHFD